MPLPRRLEGGRLAWAVAFAAALLYLAWPAARFNFDGVACAIAVELGDPRNLTHGNHLAYGVLGSLFFGLWRLLGYTGPALLPLQALSSLLGAAGAGAFATLLRRCGLRPAWAAAGGLGLAASETYWVWSLESQVYALGAAFVILAAAEAAREKPSPTRVALLQAGAILGHVGHLMFLPAAWAMLPDRRARLRHGAVLSATVAAAYAAAIFFFLRPETFRQFWLWLLGSAALGVRASTGVERHFLWHGGYSLSGLGAWSLVTLRLWGGGPFLGAGLLAVAAWGAWPRAGELPRPARLALWWLAGYAVLFLTWQPHHPVYRMTDLAPLWLLLLLGAARLRAPAAAPAALAAVLGLWNWVYVVRPASDTARNRDLQRSLWIARETPEDAWVLADGIDRVYLPYFAHRRPLNLPFYDEARLARRLDELRAAGEPVYAVPETIPPAWRPFLRKRTSVTRAENGEFTLFLIQ